MVKSIHMIPRFFCFVNVQFRRRYCSVSNDDTVQSETAEVFTAISALRDIVEDDNENSSARIAAARALLEYGLRLTEFSDIIKELEAVKGVS